MSSRKIVKAKPQYRAKLLSGSDKILPCIFCNRESDDELIYGKIYAIGNVQCHYFCALLSCCLIQKGKDEEGLFGFLYRDIIAEVDRCKKHKCSYCGQIGANLGCSVSQCRKQFHLPCGRGKNAVTMFYGNFKSYCQQHAPKQQISEHIMIKARQRMPKRSKGKKIETEIVEVKETTSLDTLDAESVCVICYEQVDSFPTVNTFWPPCCGKDAWFHRSCLQRMALSAGMHYLKCPLCNDKEVFYQAVLEQGYYVPDRDAAWELEQNAFQEIYSRVLTCSAVECKCPHGRDYDSDSGAWDIMPCGLCGTICSHLYCFSNEEMSQEVKQDATFVCDTCRTAAGDQLQHLLDSVQKLIIQEQAKTTVSTPGRRRIMPSRMSLRRTKQGAAPQPSTSRNTNPIPSIERKSQELKPQTNTTISRQELNLPTPKRKTILNQIAITNIENNLLSPLKLLEQGLNEKMKTMNVRDDISLNSSFVISIMRQKFAKPKPLSEKRKIINDILDGLLKNQLKESPKSKTPMREWISPQKRSEQSTPAQITPEKPKPNLESATPIKTNKKDQEIKIKQEILHKDEVPPIPNRLLINLLNEIDNKKYSRIETLFDKANTLIKGNPKIEIKNERHNDTCKENIGAVGVMENSNKDTKENIDKGGKCALKFSAYNKDELWHRNINLDLEMFKNSYLSEVTSSNNHSIDTQTLNKDPNSDKTSTEAPKKNLKRKSKNVERNKKNKRKRTEDKRNKKSKNKTQANHKKNKKSKKTARLSIRDKNIKLKIKWTKEQEIKVKISNKCKDTKMTQYVLSYGDNSNQVISKPIESKTPTKRKYVKTNKTPDNLKQISIESFFTKKTP